MVDTAVATEVTVGTAGMVMVATADMASAVTAMVWATGSVIRSLACMASAMGSEDTAMAGTVVTAAMAGTVGMEAMAGTGMVMEMAMGTATRQRLPATRVPWRTTTTATNDFAGQGEADFRSGNYTAAVQDFQHALINDPNNGGLMLLLAESMFASGQFSPAAGAVQLGMQMLPEAQWGVVVKNYTDLYPNIQNYTDQLRKLEDARTSNASDPALRFLLGYHYGYLGYPT